MRAITPACQNCGSSDYLCVHHTVRKSMGNGAYFNEDNLIVLCSSCHFSFHSKWSIEEERDFSLRIHGQSIYDKIHDRSTWSKRINNREFGEMQEEYKLRLKDLESI